MKKNYLFIILFLQMIPLMAQNVEANLLEIAYTTDSEPEEFIKSGSGFYFTVSDPVYGKELWYSNGTPQGSYMVRDIAAGNRDAGIKTLAVTNDLLYFRAKPDWRNDPQLWISDGTPEGTNMLKDINISEAFPFKGKIYFSNTDETNGAELWVSDGTPEGTKLFKNIREGSKGSSPTSFFEFNGTLFFVANDGGGRELWKSDGTTSGTSLVKQINPKNNGSIRGDNTFLIFDGNFYFFADDSVHGYELFKSDGTAEGTVLVKDINPNGHSSYQLSGVVTGNGVFFGANDGEHGTELWKSDGTEEGTILIKDINPEDDSFIQNWVTENYASIGSTVFFTSNDGVHGSELWKTDGTESGTEIVIDLNPGEQSSGIGYLKSSNGKLFFIAAIDEHLDKKQLWITDGTEDGTIRLNDTKIISNYSSFEFEIFSLGNKIFYDASSDQNGIELWESDGTVQGTKLFRDFNHKWGGMPRNFMENNELLYFSAMAPQGGHQLYISNGSFEGTKMVKKIGKENYSSFAEESEMISMNNEVYFSATDQIHGFELWKSDGTENGTQLVKDIFEGLNGSMYNDEYLQTFSVVEDQLFFLANDGFHGEELWVTDGSREQTRLVKDIYPGVYGSFPSNTVKLNNSIYFRAKDQSGTAIWKTDGTPEGTEKIKALNRIQAMKVVNNRLIIIAETSGTTYGPHDLWSSDGTAEGTIHIKSFGDGIDTSIQFMTIFKDELYFIAKSPDTYYKSVYKTDGTIDGTKLVYDGADAGEHIDIDLIKACGEFVYFITEKLSGYGDIELWRTEGTKESNLQISHTEAGVYKYAEALTCFQDDLYFIDGYNDEQIWKVDQNSSNIISVEFDVKAEADSSEPPRISNLFATKNILYFVGTTERTGSELYSIIGGELASLPENVENPNQDYPNFDIKVTHETCADKSNGKVSIVASEINTYIVKLNEQTIDFGREITINDLPSGEYNLCITIKGEEEFKQCFAFTIEAGVNLSGRIQSRKVASGNYVSIKIAEGTAPYTVKLDEELIGNFMDPNIDVLAGKSGRLEISSAKPCEGKIFFEVETNDQIIAFPNPTNSVLNIISPQNKSNREYVAIYMENGQLLSSKQYDVKDRVITLQLQHLSPGVYYAVIGKDDRKAIKFVKK